MNISSFFNSSKLAIAILLGAFVIAIAIIFSTFIKFDNPGQAGDNKKIYENISYIKTESSPYLGNADAEVAIVEYVDFQCPICKRVNDEIMPRLKRDYIDTNTVSYTHLDVYKRQDQFYLFSYNF